MLGLLLDAAVLMLLLKVFNDEEAGIGITLLIALLTSLVAFGLTWALVPPLGLLAIPIIGIVVSVALAFGISAIFGVEIKRSFLIAGIFLAVHIAIGIAFELLLST